MKIKNDFVTNSSSTSYIVCIPESYKFSKKIIEDNINSYDIGDYDSIDEILISANELLEKIKSGTEISLGDDDTYSYELIRMVSELIPDDLVIAGIDSKEDSIIGIKTETIKKVLNYENKE